MPSYPPMESWICGPQTFEFEAPDILHHHIRGSIEADHISFAVALGRELAAQHGLQGIIYLAHLELDEKVPMISPAARSLLAKVETNWKLGIVVGSGAKFRALAKIAANAMELLSGPGVPRTMVKSIEEARAYITEYRQLQR